MRLARLRPIAVGSTFSLVVSDGSYLYGATTHCSAVVIQIERLGGCRRCGYRHPSACAGAMPSSQAGFTFTLTLTLTLTVTVIANRTAGTQSATISSVYSVGCEACGSTSLLTSAGSGLVSVAARTHEVPRM